MRIVELDVPGTRDEVALYSASGLLPVLRVDDELLWDSLAIGLWAAETYPEAHLWPQLSQARYAAYSAVCEYHSGFAEFRHECWWDLGLRTRVILSAEAASQARRLIALWRELRGRFRDDGPYLVGEWSIADAYFTAEAARLRSYGIDPAEFGDDGTAAAYAGQLLAEPDFLDWERLAEAGA